MTSSQETGDFEQGLPEPIRSSLRSRFGPMPDVSPEIDRAILEDARQHLSAGIRPVRRHRRWSAWHLSALASTIAAASVMLLVWQRPQDGKGTDDSVAIRMKNSPINRIDNDLDQSGRVDILDAFAMACVIRDGKPGASDVNSDGRFDQLDVDLVAGEAVML